MDETRYCISATGPGGKISYLQADVRMTGSSLYLVEQPTRLYRREEIAVLLAERHNDTMFVDGMLKIGVHELVIKDKCDDAEMKKFETVDGVDLNDWKERSQFWFDYYKKKKPVT